MIIKRILSYQNNCANSAEFDGIIDLIRGFIYYELELYLRLFRGLFHHCNCEVEVCEAILLIQANHISMCHMMALAATIASKIETFNDKMI